MPRLHFIPIALVALFLTGCTRSETPNPSVAAKDPEPAPAMTNRIDAPASVRRNLGITFAKVEKRRVASTLRAPGQFELLPAARREVHAAIAGRVELLVQQYQTVDVGTPLYRIDSPQWREEQRKLMATMTAIQSAVRKLAALEGRMKAVEHHREKAEAEEVIWTAYVKKLEELAATAGGGASDLAEARAELALAHTRLAEVEEESAEIAQQRVELESELLAHRQTSPLLFADALGEKSSPGAIDLMLAPAASMLGKTIDEIRKPVEVGGTSLPYWRTVDHVIIHADRAGIIETLGLTSGAWAESSRLVLTMIQPTAVRFRAVGLQSDLTVLRDGQEAAIVPPRGGNRSLEGSIVGKVRLGFDADALQRKIDLIIELAPGQSLPPWARAGVAAEAEIITRDAGESLAIPAQAIIKDGLSHILFRRDPANPDKVIRMEADMGLSDGRWIVIESGVALGDEIVLDGVYELMLASSSSKAKGGHFHADGTFHEGDH